MVKYVRASASDSSFYVGWVKFDNIEDFKNRWFSERDFDYYDFIIYPTKDDKYHIALRTDYLEENEDDAKVTYYEIETKAIPKMKQDKDLRKIFK